MGCVLGSGGWMELKGHSSTLVHFTGNYLLSYLLVKWILSPTTWEWEFDICGNCIKCTTQIELGRIKGLRGVWPGESSIRILRSPDMTFRILT